MTLRLGIDLDGVVADFSAGWVECYNRDFGTSLDASDMQVWDAPAEMTHFADMDGFWEWARECGGGHSLFRVLRPYPGALEALDELNRLGHHLVIVTTKPDYAVSDTYAWLAEHGVPATEVHIVWDKTRVVCDVYVEDGPHNLEALALKRSEALIIRYVRPWNDPVPGVVDARDWDEVLELIAERSRGRT
ncbi:MAG TPA: hypothetical protein ENI86_10510 [Acidimicrobiales bacterium]|nr:hypothetical protein [Acidimicrobiales bacterium]